MTQTELWHEAASMAARVHHNQKRKDKKKTPYFSHPARVALTVAVKFGCTDEKILTAAFLHDVLEDTLVDYDDLLERFGEDIAEMISKLSKDSRLVESERERRYDQQLDEADWPAKLIKLADVYDNLADATDDEIRHKMGPSSRRRSATCQRDQARKNGTATVSYGYRGEYMAIKLTVLTLLGTLLCCGPEPPAAVGEVSGEDPAPPVAEPVAEAAAEPPPTSPPPKLIVDEWNPTDELLERLERSHADLRDFQADLLYEKWDNVLKLPETRTGEVLYQTKPGGSKRFAILFERLIKRNRAREHRKHYIFDGSWLVEIDHESKIFIKRQIVPPDKQFDPLKLGEGPFPLPVGQPAEEVRARFNVRRLHKPQDETLAERLAGRSVDGLRLVPKPNTPQAEEFEQAELFYDRQSLLPVGVSVTEANGDRKTVILSNLKRNAGVDENKLSIEEPDARDGWRIDVEPYKAP
jgi:outer membrane lipoprotein-sorting protein